MRLHRSIRFVLEVFLAVLLVAVLAVGALVWRLEQKPISLNTVLPEIESFLSDRFTGLHFKIEKGTLRSLREFNAIGLRLDNVSIANADGKTVGSLQQVKLGFTWQSLLSFSMMPGAIEINRPTIGITRFENGTIGFNFKEKEEEAEKTSLASSISLTDVAQFFATAPRALRLIRVRDAWVRYDNREYGYQLSGEEGLLEFHRRQQALSGTLSVRVKSGDFDQKIQGSIIDDADNEQTKLIVGLKDLDAEALPIFKHMLPDDMELTMPLTVLFTGAMNRQFHPVGADVQITGQKGQLVYAPYYPEPLHLADVMASISYRAADDAVSINHFSFDLDGARIGITGEARSVFDHFKQSADASSRPPIAVQATALVQQVPVDRLKEYWPQGVGQNARDWVTVQLRDGIAQQATLELQGIIDLEQEFVLNKMGGAIGFKGVTVDYLPPMPPVTGVDGMATYDDNSFTIAATSGQLFDTRITRGHVQIDDISNDDTRIALSIDTEGLIRDAITTISSKPLEYAQAMGMRPEQFDGHAKTRLTLSFPLVMDVSLDDVAMDAEAVLTDVVARDVIKDLDVSGKEFAFKVNTSELHLTGTGMVAGGTAEMEWREYFSSDAPLTTDIKVTGTVTPQALIDLRIPVQSYLSGNAQAKVALTQDNDKTVHVSVDADVRNLGVKIAELAVTKNAGVAGNVSLNVTNTADNITTLSDIHARWNGFVIGDGSVRFDKNQNIQSATIKNFRGGRTSADIVITPDKNNATRYVFSGDSVDLSGFWTAPSNPKKDASKPDTTRRNLSLRAKTLYLDPDVPLRDVKADIAVAGKDIVRMQVVANADNNATLLAQKLDKKAGGQYLLIKAENAGQILQALDIFDTVRGGTLMLTGDSTVEKPNEIVGKAMLNRFTLIKAPVLARLLNALSPGGMLGLLNDKGLAFQKLHSNLTVTDMSSISLSKGKMSGDSLGLSFGGVIDRNSGDINLRGTIIPIEGINKIVGSIPIIGQILTGLKGEGLIAATYSIKGKTENPDVSVNPLSVLTPGILRSIFFESGS